MSLQRSDQTHSPALCSGGISCNYWVERFAQTDIWFAQQIIISQLAELASSRVAPLERLETLEKLKKHIQFLQDALAKRYCDKPLPLDPSGEAVWNSVISLWQETIANYQQCFKACCEGDLSIAPHAAFIVMRYMRQIGSMMLEYHRVCRQPPGTLWRSLHELYTFAESNGLTSVRVQDSFVHHDPDSSCAATYAQVLRAHLASSFSPLLAARP